MTAVPASTARSPMIFHAVIRCSQDRREKADGPQDNRESEAGCGPQRRCDEGEVDRPQKDHREGKTGGAQERCDGRGKGLADTRQFGAESRLARPPASLARLHACSAQIAGGAHLRG